MREVNSLFALFGYKTTREIIINGKRLSGTVVDVNIMLGHVLVDVTRDYDGGDYIIFTTSDGHRFVMHHEQDCCESVEIKDITGDLTSLIGAPLVMAEEVSNRDDTEYGTETWTFYKFATNNGYITISWLGESNGFYSESVEIVLVPPTGTIAA